MNVSTIGRDKTLLHFVARQVAKHNHGQVGLKAALPSVMAAAKIQLSSLEVEVADLVKGLHEVTKAVEDISNDGAEDFKKVRKIASLLLATRFIFGKQDE
jgi:hypothetical protein